MEEENLFSCEESLSYLDSAYVDPAFKDKTIQELVMMIKEKNELAKEEFYMRMEKELTRQALCLAKKFNYLEDDEGAYFEMIYQATERAIRSFDPEKGVFFHFWRSVVRRERIHLISSLSQVGKKPNKGNMVFFEVQENPDFLDSLFLDSYNEDHYLQQQEEYYKEQAEACMNFICNHYSKKDVKMISMWMESYSLKEIAKALDLPVKRIYSRLYTILNSLKENMEKEMD
ncbi:MAG: hypothetical protein LKJ88_01590 [Bacilli bacterium]|jgi:DNA-directed RNA polymerase specialized sigma24 family protein|nr:hypothetical protein [Bacilli bacterium]